MQCTNPLHYAQPDLADSRLPDVRSMIKRVDERRLKLEAVRPCSPPPFQLPQSSPLRLVQRAVTAGLIAADPIHQGSAGIEKETVRPLLARLPPPDRAEPRADSHPPV